MARRLPYILAAVAVAGVIGVVGYRATTDIPARAQQGAGPARPPSAVEAATARVATVTDEVTAVGSLQSDSSVTVASEIEGRVVEIAFEEGGTAAAGAPLVRLDDTVLRAELADARAGLILAEANYARADQLFGQRTGTRVAVDEAQAALARGRAAVELAQARLDKTVIRAPFAGRLGLRQVSRGAFVTPGEAIVNLESIDPIKVDFRIGETFLPSLKVGQTIGVRVDALPGEEYQGRIYAIDPQVDINGRAIRLRATVPNPDGVLRPGLFARVNVVTATRPEAVLVPESALVPEGETRHVFAIEDGKARRRVVTLGLRRAGEVEVLSGVRPGDRIVTAGQMRLRDGSSVEVVDAQAGA